MHDGHNNFGRAFPPLASSPPTVDVFLAFSSTLVKLSSLLLLRADNKREICGQAGMKHYTGIPGSVKQKPS